MAEVKLAMHKEMLGKDEVCFGAILRRNKIDNDTLGDHNQKQDHKQYQTNYKGISNKITNSHKQDHKQSQTRSQTITKLFQGDIKLTMTLSSRRSQT